MKTYHADTFRPVKSSSMRDAAAVFAARAARREYGRHATVRTLTLESWSNDGSCGEYSAFVGLRTGLHETSGHNVRFVVTAA